MTSRPALLATAGLIAALAAGCKRAPKAGEPVSCDRMATHVAGLAKQAVAGGATSADQQRRADTELGPFHDVLQAVCTDRKWPADTRGCVAAAGTGAAVAQCVAALPVDARTPLPR